MLQCTKLGLKSKLCFIFYSVIKYFSHRKKREEPSRYLANHLVSLPMIFNFMKILQFIQFPK